MMKRTAIVLAFAFAIGGSSASARPGAKKGAPGPEEQGKPDVKVLHLPPSEAAVSEPLIIKAEVTAGWHLSRARVFYRRMGEKKFSSVDLQRSSTGDYAATIPAERVVSPGIEYYIVSKTRDGQEHRHFADPSNPHQVTVHDSAASTRERALLARHLGNRSRMMVSGGWVDFGDRVATDGRSFKDYYWHMKLDYTYRLLTWLYSIRLGGGLVRSDTLSGVRDPDPDTANKDPGLYYGFSELRLRFHDLAGAKFKVMLGVTREGFSFGGGTALIVGYDPGTHVEVGFEGAIGLGVSGYIRLAWDTVPGFPMAASVGVTNYPGNGDEAVQFLFDVERRMFDWWIVAVRAGYQARDYDIGGFTVGGSMSFEF